jgi:hypothetical protein
MSWRERVSSAALFIAALKLMGMFLSFWREKR